MTIRLCLFALFLCATRLSAAPRQFPEHNFAVEVPAGWTDIAARPPQTLVAAHSSDNSRRFVAFAVKLPANELTTGATDIRAGARKSMTEQGWRIDPEQPLTIGGLPFVAFTAHIPNGDSLTAYTTAAGQEVYMLQSMLRGGLASDDPELRAIVQSFRLLAPAEQLPVSMPPRSAAYRLGYIFGRILFFALIPAPFSSFG